MILNIMKGSREMLVTLQQNAVDICKSHTGKKKSEVLTKAKHTSASQRVSSGN